MDNKSAINSVEKLFSAFSKDINKISGGTVNVENRSKPIKISKKNCLAKLKNIHPPDPIKFIANLNSHFEYFERQLVFASSPQAFRLAWDLRSKELNLNDAERILSLGGCLTPTLNSNQLFRYQARGLILGPKKSKMLIGVRHSEGNYHDELNDLGQFTYQPPEDLNDMLRYRFYEYFEDHLKIPYVLFVSMWFAYNNYYDGEHKDNMPPETNWLYVVSPVKVVSDYRLSLKSVARPLRLQSISRKEAYQICKQYKSLSKTDLETDFRPNLKDSLAREFSYEHIKSSVKGNALKKWAQKNGLSCPDCDKSFSGMSVTKMHFGHILSQKWCSSFGFLQEKVHNPDNLYLSCNFCNSSLGKDFPYIKLREKIVSKKFGTIGDWLRENETEIRKFL